MIKKSSTIFLKTVLILIAVLVLIGLIWFPQTEGRAANLDLISIYRDPFIIYIYIASVPFFTALYQAFKLLGLVEQNKVFSNVAVKALRNIKYCSLAIISFMATALVWIRSQAGDDDPAGAMAIGIVVIFTATVIATAAGVFGRILQNAVDLKSENDLTV